MVWIFRHSLVTDKAEHEGTDILLSKVILTTLKACTGQLTNGLWLFMPGVVLEFRKTSRQKWSS